MEDLANALNLSVLELMRRQREEQPLTRQDLAEVYTQTLGAAKRQDRRKLVKAGIAALLAACVLLVAYYVPLRHLIIVWTEDYHTTGEVAALLTRGSREDRRTAQPIMALAEEAFSSIGLTEAGAERAYGKLSRYTYNKDIYADVAAERHTLKLLSAHFEYSEGLIWVYYTQEGLDQNGERTTGSFQVRSLWKLCKGNDGKWYVYDIKEHP